VIGPTGAVRVMVATKPVDFRKGAEGLAALVRETMGADPFSGAIYVFRARRAKLPTFCIWFPLCGGLLPMASAVRANVASLAVSPRQGVDMHLYRRAARPLPRAPELDVRRELLLRHDVRAA
jgi:transposase